MLQLEAEYGIYREPLLLFRLQTIRRRIYESLGDLEVRIATSPEPIPLEAREARPLSRIVPGQTWGRAFTCAWFNLRGRVTEAGRGRHVVALVDLGGEGLLVDGEGRAVQGLSDAHCWVDRVQAHPGKGVIEISPASTGAEEVELWVEAGYNGGLVKPYGSSRFGHAWLAICRDDLKDLYYEYLVLSFAAAACGRGPVRASLLLRLSRAWRKLGDYSPGAVAEARAILAEARMGASPGSPNEASEPPSFTAIGHSHLDLAWLWPIRETRRKAARTFATALAKLKSYPGYVYGASQPQQFQWIKEDRPELYERLKAAVAGGRMELQGGMWVEADTNLPSGESLVRQILYGKDFFQREFGQTMRMCWLPDVFGYNANLPQILKKTGLEYFMTIKLSWNEHNDFPHRSFVWEGIDGSRVLVHMAPEGEYNSGATPLCVRRAARSYPEASIAKEGLLIYGAGDGGGGPGEAHLEFVKRQADLPGLPRVLPGRAIDFFDRLSLHRDALPLWKGELYLEKHQGTYTSQARNKAANRRMEFLLHEIEYLGSLALLHGGAYPSEVLEAAWKEVLLYQFHDIIPGSAIGRVYAESLAGYAGIKAKLEAAREGLLGLFPRKGLAFINTSPFPRKVFLKADDSWLRAEAPAYASAPFSPAPGPFGLSWGADHIENENLRVVFSPEGHIASLVDAATGRDYGGRGLNRLVLYADPWRFFNAWDIDESYPRRHRTALRAVSTETFVDGPRVVRRARYRHGRTSIVQDTVLVSGSGLVEFETSCDWHETFRMLRADFLPPGFPDRITCEIQFGAFERGTGEADPVEKAQFEVCAHSWVDLALEAGGLSLINDSKYGLRAKAGLLSLNLLRSPVYPDPKADRGRQAFRYALYPHGGDWREAGTVAEAWAFNAPALAAARALPERPLAVASSPNVMVETVKKAEASGDLVLRLRESQGRACVTGLALAFPCRLLEEADLLEAPTGKADPEALAFGPYEVKTLIARL